MQRTDTNTVTLPPVAGDLVRIDSQTEKYVGVVLERIETQNTEPNLLRVQVSEGVVTAPQEEWVVEIVELGRLAPKKLFRQFGCKKYEVLGK